MVVPTVLVFIARLYHWGIERLLEQAFYGFCEGPGPYFSEAIFLWIWPFRRFFLLHPEARQRS